MNSDGPPRSKLLVITSGYCVAIEWLLQWLLCGYCVAIIEDDMVDAMTPLATPLLILGSGKWGTEAVSQ